MCWLPFFSLASTFRVRIQERLYPSIEESIASYTSIIIASNRCVPQDFLFLSAVERSD